MYGLVCHEVTCEFLNVDALPFEPSTSAGFVRSRSVPKRLIRPSDLEARERYPVLFEHRPEDGLVEFVSEQLDALNRRIENAVVGLERAAETRQARIQRAADLEQRIDTAYTTLTGSRLDAVDDRIETALQEIEHAAETEAVTVRAARGRIGGLESRIDRAYETHITQETEALERRIESAYRDIETDTDVQEAKQEARQLRIIILVLIGLLLLGVALWAGGLL